MPKHKPIRFEDPSLPEKIRERIKFFTKTHPIASSALQVLMAIIAVGGTLTIAAAMPGLVGAFGKVALQEKRARRDRYNKLWHNFYKLKKSRAIEYIGEKNGEMLYRLTSSGRGKLKSFLLETLEIKTPPRWDGRWRVVVFDIPEKKFKNARRAIQRKLASMGFYPMQKSVWVYPFPCEEEIEFLKDFFNIKPYVDILVVPEMPSGKVIYYFKEALKPLI